MAWVSVFLTLSLAPPLVMWLWFSRTTTLDPVQLALSRSKDPNPPTVAVCERLAANLPERVFFRTHDKLLASVRSYWSAQEQAIIPYCTVQPQSAIEVRQVIRILHEGHQKSGNGVHFAVRSGGHAPNAGSANARDGINVDLKHMCRVYVSEDRTKATIGPAARWIDVYRKLDPLGLAVVGGRASNAGVGGLTLGGGISFFSPRAGFVCDNVIEYEVVLADGKIVHANKSKYRDLWLALKGGANNFGIVTSFTMRCFPNSKIWAGYIYHPVSVAPKILQAFYDLTEAMNHDEYANGFIAFGYDAKIRVTGIASIIQYTKSEKHPPALNPFMKIRRFWSTVKVRSLSDATKEINSHSPAGLRQLFRSTTFESNLDMLQFCFATFKNSLEEVKGVKGIAWALVLHPLPRATTTKSLNNALGISTTKDLIIVQVSTSWKRAIDDLTIDRVAQQVINSIEVRAADLGVFNRYKYINYSTPSQDPFSGYGESSRRNLKEVSLRYDPDHLFQESCRGGFKLWEDHDYGAPKN